MPLNNVTIGINRQKIANDTIVANTYLASMYVRYCTEIIQTLIYLKTHTYEVTPYALPQSITYLRQATEAQNFKNLCTISKHERHFSIS